MKIFLLFFSLILSLNAISETKTTDRESNDYKYTALGIHFIESEKSGFAINLSLELLGPFYATFERRADGIDYKTESYDKVVDTFRLGAHKGIGDLIGGVSLKDFKFKIKNLFDVFVEVGVKTSDFDGKKFDFEGDSTFASYVGGIRFGNSNNFEGKIFLDISKEARIIDSGDPTCQALICPPYSAEIYDESDKKFGAGLLYNINNRSAIFIEMSSSNVIDNMFKIGYQLNF